MDLAFSVFQDIQPGRLFESLVFLFVLLWRIKPHLNIIEDRMTGIERTLETLEKSMTLNFKEGDTRFRNIETKLSDIESRVSHCEKYKPEGCEK